MGIRIEHHDYGKSRVRLLKVRRRGEVHDVRDLDVQVMAEGDFEEAYTKGDNRRVLPTDTIKNTVYGVARGHAVDRIESFGRDLAAHFLKGHAPMTRVTVTIDERTWVRIVVPGPDGASRPPRLVRGSDERATAEVVGTRDGARVTSGLAACACSRRPARASRTTRATSGPRSNPPRTGCSRRPSARVDVASDPRDFAVANQRVRDALLEMFAVPYSPSAQETLSRWGRRHWSAAPRSSASRCPCQLHHLLCELKPSGSTIPTTGRPDRGAARPHRGTW